MEGGGLRGAGSYSTLTEDADFMALIGSQVHAEEIAHGRAQGAPVDAMGAGKAAAHMETKSVERKGLTGAPCSLSPQA